MSSPTADSRAYERHAARFDAANCPACEREVVLYHDVRDGELVFACLLCDTGIDPSKADTRHRAVSDMTARKLGLHFPGDEDVPEFEGCGKPNCNKGQCKSTAARHPFEDASDDVPSDETSP